MIKKLLGKTILLNELKISTLIFAYYLDENF